MTVNYKLYWLTYRLFIKITSIFSTLQIRSRNGIKLIKNNEYATDVNVISMILKAEN